MADLTVLSPATATPLERLVDDFLHSCRARGLSLATMNRGYGHALRRVLLPWCEENGISSIEQLDQRTLDRFTSWLHTKKAPGGRTLSPVSVHTFSRTVSQFLAWCQREGETVNGKPQLPRLGRRVIDVLSRDEVDAMETAAVTERDRLIIRLLADTGMRVGELCTLSAASVVQRDRRVFLNVTGKGDNSRLVPLPPPLVRRLERYLRSRPKDTSSPYIFLSLRRARHGDYEALTTSGVLDVIKSQAYRAGISKRVYPHLFRHSFATEALRSGMNPIQLAQILGHTSLRMIERTYSHLDQTDAYEAVLKMLANPSMRR
jgi:site-specific recombinase XerD